MTISGVFGKKLSLALAPLILAACAADMPSAVEIPRDESGAAFLTYQQARGPLANFVDAGAPDGFARVSPTAPPSSFSQGEQSSYWMGMTAGGCRTVASWVSPESWSSAVRSAAPSSPGN